MLVLLLGIISWTWQKGVSDYTEAVKSNTSAVNRLTTEVVGWGVRTGELVKDVAAQESVNIDQWKVINDHERRIARIEK